MLGSDGRIDPRQFYSHMRDKVANSPLRGQAPAWGRQFGINTGSPDEWARFWTMLQQQESGHRTARTNPDGSLQRFGSTIPTEKSFGPGQFNVGEYGLKTWADVNNPERVADAYINVALANKVPNYFGSVQRPHEITQHGKWFSGLGMGGPASPSGTSPWSQQPQQRQASKPEDGVQGFGSTDPSFNAFSSQQPKWSDGGSKITWSDGSNAFGPQW